MSSDSLLLLLFLVPILALIIKRKTTSSKWHLPPSPPKLPLIGNLHQLGPIVHQSLHALSETHGPVMLLKLGQVPTMVVSSADIAEEIMKTHDHIFASRPSLLVARILLFDSMDVAFAPYGDYWRQIRRICVVNLLSAKMVQSFQHMREKEVASMASKISSSEGVPVNLTEVLNLFANNIMCRAISGKCFRDGRSDVMCRLTDENITLLAKFSLGDCIPMLGWLDEFSGLKGRARRNFKRWNEVLDEIIEEGGQDSEEERSDFVNVLLALQKDNDLDFPLDGRVIKAILLDMFAAGTDTTSITLDWCMAELIRNSETLRILKDEIRRTVKTEPVIKEEDLSKLMYLKAVIKETLRLHSPVPLLIPRESLDYCKIQGYDIPKKTRVIVNAWAIGRDPKLWEAPEEFRPERFMDSHLDFKGRNFQYIPFGAGRRICPGMQFAVSTIELALANIVHQFEWKLPSGMESKDLDMAEGPGLTSRRKQSLHLVPKKFTI